MKTSFVKLAVPCVALLAVAAAMYLVGGAHISPEQGLVMAAVVQASYAERMPVAYAGMIANMTNYDSDTRTCETAAGIGFGLAVGQGTDDKGVILGVSAAAEFVGITIRDVTLVHDTADKYAQYDNVNVLTEGDIWVTTGGVVNAGDNVTVAAATGVLSTAATSGSQFDVAGARWMTSAGNGELAVVRLSGHLPGA